MAEVDVIPTLGSECKVRDICISSPASSLVHMQWVTDRHVQDGFKPASVWVANGIAWLDDIQAFYRERSVIEKEYSAKLNTLAKKYFDKKARKSASLSVGDTPTLTPGSLERCAFQ